MQNTYKFKIFNSCLVILCLLLLTHISVRCPETYPVDAPPYVCGETEVPQSISDNQMIVRKDDMKSDYLTYDSEGKPTTDAPKTSLKYTVNEEEISMLCKVTYGEAGSLSKTQQAAVVWCILNRVDSEVYPNTISEVITQKSQFYGYKESHPIVPETKEIVIDVLLRWENEQRGELDVGRVLPKEYMYFTGNGKENIFRLTSKSDSTAWDWSLPSPYSD